LLLEPNETIVVHECGATELEALFGRALGGSARLMQGFVQVPLRADGSEEGTKP
jgi:hypothetical protein